MSGGVSLLVAHRDRLLAESLAIALDREPGIDVVGFLDDRRNLALATARMRPDVALLHADFARRSLSEAQQDASCGGGRTALLDDEEDVDVLAEAIQAGVEGYVVLGEDLAEVAHAARRVAAGEVVVPPLLLGPLLRRLLARRQERDEVEERFRDLTPREREVLQLLVDGLDREELSRELVISEHTARSHIQNVLRKLEVHSRLEAVTLAVGSGWTRPRPMTTLR